MAYSAVLDADVLHPYNAVDLLLRIADHRLFRPVWSNEILDELERSLTARGLPPDRVRRRVSQMSAAFPEALVEDVPAYLPSVPKAVHADDRHVVAAALAGRADGIVTNNTRHFPTAAIEPLGLEVQSLDEFLVNQLTLDQELVVAALLDIEADRTRPPRTPAELLDALEVSAPVFVKAMRTIIGDG